MGLQNSLTTIQVFFFPRLLMEYTDMQGDEMSASMPDDNVSPTRTSGGHVDETQGVRRRMEPLF